jgi:hypothetical protein
MSVLLAGCSGGHYSGGKSAERAFEPPHRSANQLAMSERSRQSGDARSERQRRLAEALRMNLRRRKAQQRERQDAGESDGPAQPNRTGDSD